MNFYQSPELYTQFLGTQLLDKIYNAMKTKNDLSDVAFTATDILKETKSLPTFERQVKSDKKSKAFRDEGNQAYKLGKLNTSLKFYNKALLYAPDKSQAMILAYSNRSALFLKTKNYSACLKDVETCLSMNCPKDIAEKLAVRKQSCQKYVHRDKVDYISFNQDFFTLNMQHPLIPCATTDVEVNFDSGLPKIVAAKDIKIGTVIAVENAFTCLLNPTNQYVSCYHCHRMSLNLLPCGQCCYALFCDNDCKQSCMEESHSVECYVTELLHSNSFGPYSRITLRTVLKVRQMCESWKEFTEASKMVGTERLLKTHVKDLYDCNNKFSILSFENGREIKDGALYNFGFMCGTQLQQIYKIPDYLPVDGLERDTAIRSFARMSMKVFLLFMSKIEVNCVADDNLTQNVTHLVPNYGYYSFASKLPHSCDSNLVHVGLNREVVLIALKPIKKGRELTLSYVEHAYEYIHMQMRCIEMKQLRRVQLYRFGVVCLCKICEENWPRHRTLNDDQRRCFRKWISLASDVKGEGDRAYKATCEAMAKLQGQPHTSEFCRVYAKFRALLGIYQFLATKNYSLDNYY